MFVLCCNITIGTLTFNYVNNVDIVSTWKNLTTTGTIHQPRNIKLSQMQLRDLIKPNMPVTVQLGYNNAQNKPQYYTEFTGYVVRVAPKLPLEIQCEDEMYQWKKGTLTKSFGAGTLLSEVIKYITPATYKGTVNMWGDTELGAFVISKATPADVLTDIKKVTGFPCFFRNGNLTIGKPYDPTTLTHRNYIFNYSNANGTYKRGNVISNELEYKNAADIKVKVEAISMQRSGGRVVATLGDTDGETHTLTCPCDLNLALLTKFATQEMQRLKVDGYRGGMTTFGYPQCEHGDVANLSGTSTPLIIGESSLQDHDGAYFIDEVHKTFGMGGYRRIVTLGPKARGYTDFHGNQILPSS